MSGHQSLKAIYNPISPSSLSVAPLVPIIAGMTLLEILSASAALYSFFKKERKS